MYAINIHHKQFESTIKKESDKFLVELYNEFQKVKKSNEIIPVIIDMSIQSDGIINFNETNDVKIIDKPIQIYLHKLQTIEKFLEPIILTKENKYKLYRIISRLKFDGYTEQSVLDEWIKNNNINQCVIFY